ncbi:hypothetical protein [Pseudomonas sp. RA_105y_Pfl2_P56]|uniref:hypothetical protein n=1 Tax=Pseudomonas sp. RA_105y_Pfl2_P56 TaxID=3088701 RepID=UPI0030DA0381
MIKKTPEITVPLLAVGIFCIPIFLINLLLPAAPQTSWDFALNEFVDEKLFGLTGFWSSVFPFSSKVTANYIAITGPIFASTIFCKVHKTMNIDPTQYQTHLFARIIVGIFFTTFITLFCTLAFYLTNTDLGQSTGRFANLFGRNVLFYSIYSSGMLILFFLIPFSFHRLFFYFPRLMIKKSQEKKRRSHSK